MKMKVGDKMLKYRLIKDTPEMVSYRYFPEGEDESGVVVFDKATKECSIKSRPESDRHSLYAFKLFRKIEAFAESGSFKKEGLIAWY